MLLGLAFIVVQQVMLQPALQVSQKDIGWVPASPFPTQLSADLHGKTVKGDSVLRPLPLKCETLREFLVHGLSLTQSGPLWSPADETSFCLSHPSLSLNNFGFQINKYIFKILIPGPDRK